MYFSGFLVKGKCWYLKKIKKNRLDLALHKDLSEVSVVIQSSNRV